MSLNYPQSCDLVRQKEKKKKKGFTSQAKGNSYQGGCSLVGDSSKSAIWVQNLTPSKGYRLRQHL
jgi:hypothetical protein